MHTHRNQRGVALLIAIVAISLVLTFSSEVILNVAIWGEQTALVEEQAQAEYLAKSGGRLGVFLVTLSHTVDLAQAKFASLAGGGNASPAADPTQGSPPPPASPGGGLSKAPVDGPQSLWAVFNSLAEPIGKAAVDLALAVTKGDEDPLGLRGVLNEKTSEQMALLRDSFTLKVLDERGRININDCAIGQCREVIKQLQRLFSCPVEKAFLEDKKLKPSELAVRIKDFINQLAVISAESGMPDLKPYESATPPYGLRGVAFDSLSELKLVSGWDDEVHAVFAPYLTVYPPPRISGDAKHRLNLNAVAPELFSCLIPEAASDACRQSYLVNAAQREAKNEPVTEGGEVGEVVR